jgi:hypothetical protein
LPVSLSCARCTSEKPPCCNSSMRKEPSSSSKSMPRCICQFHTAYDWPRLSVKTVRPCQLQHGLSLHQQSRGPGAGLRVEQSVHPTSPRRFRMAYCRHAGWLSQSLQAVASSTCSGRCKSQQAYCSTAMIVGQAGTAYPAKAILVKQGVPD